jgi:prolyl 4-hydroxylase
MKRLALLSIALGVPTLILFHRHHHHHHQGANPFSLVFSQKSFGFQFPVASSSSRFTSSFSNDNDPNLLPMTFHFPDDDREKIPPRKFLAYVQPDVSTFYRDVPGTHRPMKPRFQGLAGKFVNLSPDYLALYWEDGHGGSLIADMPPFQAVGTATFPVHEFFISKKKDKHDVVHRIHIHPDQNLYVYDAFELGHANVQDLSSEELDLYHIQKHNLYFAAQYREFTGRDWLSLYPHRQRPMYKMWNADYFGQQHWVMSSETHYIAEPPDEMLGRLRPDEMHRDRRLYLNARNLTRYRSEESSVLNMTLTVLSCAPRVFEIQNFLSHAEVDHIIHMATGMKLRLSTTSGSDGGGHDARSDSQTRTSHNSWVDRGRSPIMDSIYSRAADLMQIDEALLRHRHDSEFPEVPHKGSNAEDFQLVHYAESEQYTAHHDFSYPNVNKNGQPARFATLLLYLNEGMMGGETTFPRWVNSESGDKLRVKPEIGKGILFYNQLPDGNMDDLSQHAAEPVLKGEKWLINLWTWDPRFR